MTSEKSKACALPAYQRNQQSVELALLCIFAGNISSKRRKSLQAPSAVFLTFPYHQNYIRSWIAKHFNIRPAFYQHHPGVRSYLRYNLGVFAFGAAEDGWRLKKKDWIIPNWVMQQYPKLILRQ